MNYKHHWINCLVFCAAITFMVQSHAAEYSDNHIVPEITSTVFTQDYVALTLEPAFWRELIPDAERHERFFLANRTDYQFRQITKQEFSELLENDHFHRQLGDYQGARDLRSERGLNVVRGSCAHDSFRPTEFGFEDLHVTVDLKCGSSVIDAIRFDDEMWIATYTSGSHGDYGAEGLLVTSLEGDVKARINTGGYAATGLAQDPWSTDMWVLTLDRITVVTENYTIKRRYWPIHDFDKDMERPDVFVVDSSKGLQTNPLAVLAYRLGEKHYQKFFRSIKDLPDERDQFSLYDLFMGGRYHNPQLPIELNALLSDAEPTHTWRNFVCLLHDERAKELCTLELDRWPETLR